MAAAASTGGLNTTLLGEAKKEAARRQLYSGFLRGKVVGGSMEEAEKERVEKERKALLAAEAAVPTPSDSGEDAPRKKSKRKRVESTAPTRDDDDAVLVSHADAVPSPEPFAVALPSPAPSDEPKEKRKKKRKVAVLEPEHLSPEEGRSLEEEAYLEARAIAKMAAKEERRLEKVVRRALRDGRKKEDADES